MLTELDTNLSKSVRLRFEGAAPDELGGEGVAGEVWFQFPPRITSDNRKGNWVEKELRADQPEAAYRLSGGREMRMEWVYIVGESGGGGMGFTKNQPWSTTDVRRQVVGLRNYFSKVPHRGKAEGLVGTLAMWLHGGIEEMTIRIRSVDVSHGKIIVVPQGNTFDAYPLRTDVSLDLRIWDKAGVSGGDEGEIKLEVPEVRNATPIEWV